MAKSEKLKDFHFTRFGFNALNESLKLEKLNILNDTLLNSNLERFSSHMSLKHIAKFVKNFKKEDLPCN
jgi:hypothetical protein